TVGKATADFGFMARALATTPGADTVELQTPIDPCEVLMWRISYTTAAGELRTVDVQAGTDDNNNGIADWREMGGGTSGGTSGGTGGGMGGNSGGGCGCDVGGAAPPEGYVVMLLLLAWLRRRGDRYSPK